MRDLGKVGIYNRGNPRTKSQKLEIVQLYHKVKNISEMERNYGIPHTSTCSILDEFNISRYIKSKNFSKTKSCNSYKDRFSSLSEELKGYICGLIATDGSLDKSRKRIEISQCEENKEIILSLASILADPPLKVQKRVPRNSVTRTTKLLTVQNQYRIAAVLPDLYDFCICLGLTPNKTMSLKVDLRQQSKKFNTYFLRGCLDGDGMVKIMPSMSSCEIRIVSASPTFLDCLEEVFGGNRSGNLQATGSMLYYLSFLGNVGKSLAKSLPKEDYMLSRKSIKLNELCLKPSIKTPSKQVLEKILKIEEATSNA